MQILGRTGAVSYVPSVLVPTLACLLTHVPLITIIRHEALRSSANHTAWCQQCSPVERRAYFGASLACEVWRLVESAILCAILSLAGNRALGFLTACGLKCSF